MLELSRPLVVLDLEATGTDPSTARIFQIAMQRLIPVGDAAGGVTGPVPGDELNITLDPQVQIPERIVELTGCNPEYVRRQQTFEELAWMIGPMIEDADLAGYNALRYDVPLLAAEYERIGETLPGPDDRVVVDPYLLEKALCPRDLATVYRKYTGEEMEGAHDAAADVEATIAVLDSQLYYHEPENTTPAALAKLARGPYLDDGRKLKRRGDGAVELCFGKHRGKTLRWVNSNDPGYLDWMHAEVDGLAPHIDAALAEA